MLQLSEQQINNKKDFIHQYFAAKNAADGSKMDANANVTNKNIATLEAELLKDCFLQINRALVSDKITELFDKDLATEYQRQIQDHEIYVHDETSLKPYCASISMYPFLLDGLTKLGGESKAPKHLASFCGSFVNLVFAISSQFAGAVATVEFLTYFDYFARKEFDDNYLEQHGKDVANHLQHVVYALNQPAAARGYQSVFWNISLFDQFYFQSMFADFVFPDFSKPNWQSVESLQKFFLTWINKERDKSVLTFPVITAAMLTENGQCKDQQFAYDLAKEKSEGNSFFVYLSDSADSLASCCRLRNEISDNTFSFTLGAGGVATGSIIKFANKPAIGK
jgi:ribonucleoside-triphosphate reductase